MSTLFQANPEAREAHGKPYSFIPLAGCLDKHNLEDFSETMEPLIKNHHTYLIFDLSELDFVSSHAAGYFENMHQKLETIKKRMAFVNANTEIREILESIGLAKLITMFDVEEKFLEAVVNEEI